MEFLIKFTEIMLSNFWYFIGCFLVLALLLEVFEKVACKFFDFLIFLVKRSEKNNFYISEKNINAKFIEELKKYGKKRAAEQ